MSVSFFLAMNFQKILELFLKFLKICILKNFLPEVEVKRMNISNSLKIIHHIKGGDLRLSILHSHSHDCTLIPGMLWKIVPSREIPAVRIELVGLESSHLSLWGPKVDPVSGDTFLKKWHHKILNYDYVHLDDVMSVLIGWSYVVIIRTSPWGPVLVFIFMVRLSFESKTFDDDCIK